MWWSRDRGERNRGRRRRIEKERERLKREKERERARERSGERRIQICRVLRRLWDGRTEPGETRQRKITTRTTTVILVWTVHG